MNTHTLISHTHTHILTISQSLTLIFCILYLGGSFRGGLSSPQPNCVKFPFELLMPYLLYLFTILYYTILYYTYGIYTTYSRAYSNVYLELSGAVWSCLELSEAIWSYLKSSGAIWSYLEPLELSIWSS